MSDNKQNKYVLEVDDSVLSMDVEGVDHCFFSKECLQWIFPNTTNEEMEKFISENCKEAKVSEILKIKNNKNNI